MEIVEVRFVKDSQSVQTGNEFYPAGATAHFYAHQAVALAEAGDAEMTELAEIDDRPSLPKHYGTLTVKLLRMMAKEQGIPGASNMRKADLIAALEDNT